LTEPNNAIMRSEYCAINKKVKNKVKACRTEQLQKKVEELENDLENSNSHNLFKTVRYLESKPPRALTTAKDKEERLKTKVKRSSYMCCEEDFKKHLNIAFPRDNSALDTITDPRKMQSRV